MTSAAIHTTINYRVMEKLNISPSEYCLADQIYHLANNPDSKHPGWCYASKPHFAKMLLVTERAIYKMIDRLIDKGYIERDPDTKFLKTTHNWYSTAVVKTTHEQSSVSMNKVHATHEQSSVPPMNKVHANNKENIKKNILSKDNKAETAESGSGKKKEYGNPLVNHVGKSFFLLTGQEPVETNWRFEAHNLVRSMTTHMKPIDGAAPSEEHIKQGIDIYFRWLHDKAWTIYRMRTVREHFKSFRSEAVTRTRKEVDNHDIHKSKRTSYTA